MLQWNPSTLKLGETSRQIIKSKLEELSIQVLPAYLEYTKCEDVTGYRYKHHTSLEITSFEYTPSKHDEEVFYRFIFHFLVEQMPEHGYQELFESMTGIYSYYRDIPIEKHALPTKLPSIQAQLAEPKHSEVISISE